MKEDNPHRKKHFLKLPVYKGGNAAFRKFIEENLQYPEQALRAGISGTVYLRCEVNDLGKIEQVKVEKGIGHGCDEEAIRLAKLMEYEPAKNRGVRVKTWVKTRIEFKLPGVQIQFNYTMEQKPQQDSPPKTTYGYTLNIE